MTETAETTEIISIPHKSDVPALFSKEGGIEGLVKRIEKEARSIVIDATTPMGRKDAKSLAAKVSRSKTLIDEVGKEQNEERNRLNKEVNALRNLAKDRLDALRDEIRKPVEEWEQKEIDRVRELEKRMDVFGLERTNAMHAVETIKLMITEVEAVEIDASWEEYEADARTAKAAALDKYRADLGTAQVREDQEAELMKLRADAEAREKADAERAEKDAAERADRERAEREQKATQEAEQRAKEAAERAAQEAEAKAARELAEAKEAHAKELAEAKERAEAAAQAERDRIAAEEKAKADAEAKRAANKKHRQKIRQEAIDALAKIGPESFNEIIDAIIAGDVPHTTITF
jgi:hypothetical protein